MQISLAFRRFLAENAICTFKMKEPCLSITEIGSIRKFPHPIFGEKHLSYNACGSQILYFAKQSGESTARVRIKIAYSILD